MQIKIYTTASIFFFFLVYMHHIFFVDIKKSFIWGVQGEEVDVNEFLVTDEFHPDTILQWLSGEST